ncbi:hypothetical protein VTK56DRAFT_8897 [Thermocarpiscus australiensis]
MASVYQNSTLVTSAAKSSGAYDGLYAELSSKHGVHTVRTSPPHNDDTANAPAMMRFKNSRGGRQPASGAKPWDLIELDILDGHMKNLCADDDCQSLLPSEGEQPRMYCLLIRRKLPMKELLCLVLARVPLEADNAPLDRRPQEDGYLYRRIGLLKVLGGPPSPVPWGWMHSLLGEGEDASVRIV